MVHLSSPDEPSVACVAQPIRSAARTAGAYHRLVVVPLAPELDALGWAAVPVCAFRSAQVTLGSGSDLAHFVHVGQPCYQIGKLELVHGWLTRHGVNHRAIPAVLPKLPRQ